MSHRVPTGALLTAGGRVLDVTGTGPTLAEARRRAYEGVSHISWPGMQHRHDIALSASLPAAVGSDPADA